MLTNDREIRTCAKYSAYDDTGHVHCHECPLTKGNFSAYDFRCKANSHFNRSTGEWEYDDWRSKESVFCLSCDNWKEGPFSESCLECFDENGTPRNYVGAVRTVKVEANE